MFNAADLIIFQLSPGQTCDSHSLYQDRKLHRTVQDYYCFQFHANSCLLERTQWIGQSLWAGERKANFPGDDEAWRKSFHLKTLFHLLVAGRNIKLLDFAFPSLLPRSHLNVSSHQRRFKKALRSTKRDYLIPHIVMNALSIGEHFLPIQFKLLSVNTSSENLKMRWKYILTMHIRQKGGRWNAFDSQMELKCFQSEKLGGSRSRSQTNLFCASHSMDRRRLYFIRAIKLSKICQRIVFLAICCSHWLKSIFLSLFG